MNVKKGIASSVSFCMMPNTRSGNAWNMFDGNRPASMPIKPNSKPVAARPNATGMPVSRKTKSPANISGTKFCAMKAVISACSCQLLFGLCGQLFGQEFLV